MGNWTGELGVDLEDSSVDPSGRCESSSNNTSLSGGVLYELGNEANLLFGASRSQRAPGVEERYSNVSLDTCAPESDYENLVFHVMEGEGSPLSLGVFGDIVNAEFDTGGYVPCLPAGLYLWGIPQNAVC